MISFDNTEIAFKSKSDKDLRKAYWLFKIVGNPSMVKMGKTMTNFSLKAKLPIKGIIKNTIFHQFCGGETIPDCANTIKQLGDFGIGTILDYSIEGKTSEDDFDATVKEIVATIQEAKNSKHIPFGVFKVTGISRFEILEKANPENANLSDSEQKELQAVINRVDIICKAGFDAGIPVFIDAEETWIQDTIDRICIQMMKKYNLEKAIVYNTAQMYRHDRLAFLEKEIKEAREGNYFYGIKLVRGAYMEKERERAAQKGYPSPIQPTKDASDRDFNKALELIIDNIDVISLCAGTHNEDSSNYLADLITKKGLAKDDSRIYFAQLLGMSDHISYNLAFNNYRVAKYVPFGPIEEVMPYLLRRADENTSVAGQTSRELRLIMSERNRRKK
ncbi:MAG: proline dehydrogenase family protein [Fluviicola sp.]|jgi:proline dehydrogenase|nr:proline dehydrogenase family protein [Fluviicola sp.]